MSEIPSFYIPRRLRPRRILPDAESSAHNTNTNTRFTTQAPKTQMETPQIYGNIPIFREGSTHRPSSHEGSTHIQAPRESLLRRPSSRENILHRPSSRENILHRPSSREGAMHSLANRENLMRIDNTDQAVGAIFVSGMLGKQICSLTRLASHMAGAEPAICAFLLGYMETDGTAHLNQLDQGIECDGQRVPTFVHGTDIVVPLYRGSSKSRFYASIVRPGFMCRMAAWLNDSEATSAGGRTVDFISIRLDIRVSVNAAPAVDLASLPGLLTHLHQERGNKNGGASWGRLSWAERVGRYEHKIGPLTPPADSIWVDAGAHNPSQTIGDAFVNAGAPWSLRVVQVSPTDSHRSATLRHNMMTPVSGEYNITVHLAPMELAGTSQWTTSTVKLMSASQCGNGVYEAICEIARRSGVSVVERNSSQILEPARRPPSRQYKLPMPANIPETTQALVCTTPKYPARASLSSIGAANSYRHGDEMTSESSQMSELLNEQRNIRALLEEQNGLMKVHVSQTQELMRLAHQPSPQTVTRRYLRMKGTHTPVAAGGRQLRPAITEISEDGSNPRGLRRSNSLSEIVEGIRSFEVEGYEETEHVTFNAYRRPLSFASQLYSGAPRSEADGRAVSSFSAAEGTSASRSVSSSTSGISGLVSRIKHIVSDTGDSARGSKRPYDRPPPIPATRRRVGGGGGGVGSTHANANNGGSIGSGSVNSQSYKLTPTTQKYLNSLDQRSQDRLQMPAFSRRRSSRDDDQR